MNPAPRPGNDRLRTYRDATDFIGSLVRTPPRTREEREKLGLSPIRSLLERIGRPHHRLAAIHVTGSKGKGSTALYTEALLHAAGYRTGTFTSPHLEDWNERIRVAGASIDHSRFVAALERIRPDIVEMHHADADSAPAFFDALVAAAFSEFADAGVDFAVVEAGIGARLDPTRVCRAVATCVTSVELEHAERLGPTVADIAREKAAIARPDIPLVTGSMPDAAMCVVEHEAARVGAPVRTLGRDITIRAGAPSAPTCPAPSGPALSSPGHREPRGRTVAPSGGHLETGVAEVTLSDRTIRIALRQPGRHMVENAALALALANEVGALGRLDDTAAQAALETAVLPGRTEVLGNAPRVIADGAHTRASIEALVEVLGPRPAAPTIAVVSVTRGKDPLHLLRPLVRRADVVIATAAEPSRSLPARALAGILRDSTPGAAVEAIEAPGDAIHAATRLAGVDGMVCAAGSMYLAGAARRALLSG